ncbi:MAG TPA: CYTH domain-containing protein, partial [Pyrinomonadaceae bacterium]|nr:CYTH domain-containing protein [Pyrinomonadaceae bacterium]
MALEIEKKFRITDAERKEILGALEEFGAEFVREDFEENTLFSNDDLFERNAIVRIRRIDDQTILTFKQRIASTSDAKQQTEYESEVSDADA